MLVRTDHLAAVHRKLGAFLDKKGRAKQGRMKIFVLGLRVCIRVLRYLYVGRLYSCHGAHLGHWLLAAQPPFCPNLLGSFGLAGSKLNWDGLQVLSQPSPVSGLQNVQMLHCAHALLTIRIFTVTATLKVQ